MAEKGEILDYMGSCHCHTCLWQVRNDRKEKTGLMNQAPTLGK